MNETPRPPAPPDLSLYHQNRPKIPQEELAKHAGRYVAFSPDGSRVVASGSTMEEVEQVLQAAGIDPSQVVGSYLPPPEVVLL